MYINKLPGGLQSLKEETLAVLDNPDLAGYDSATLFIAQGHRKPESTAYSLATHIGESATSFAGEHIESRAVDLAMPTPLRDVFESRARSVPLRDSVRNPQEHLVWGAPLSGISDVTAVLQLALLKNSDQQTTDAELGSYFHKRWPQLDRLAGQAIGTILRSGRTVERALLAWNPTTPNAIIIHVDRVKSTPFALHNAPLLLDELDTVVDAFMEAYKQLGIQIATGNGDGNNYVIPLPVDIRLNPAAIEAFTHDAVDPAMAILRAQFKSIRAAHLAGYVTTGKRGETTSRDFWLAAQKARGVN